LFFFVFFFFFQAEDGIRDYKVTGVQTCALPISEVTQVFEIARDRSGASRVRFLPFELRELDPQFAGQAVQPSLPTVLSADDGCLHDQVLPVPGRPEGSRDYGRFARFPFTWRRSRSGSGAGGRRALGRGAGDAQRFVFGSHPDVAIARRSPRFVKLRDLAERQVLREAPGGKSLDRAGQQGEEGPPGRIGNCGPASEIHGNTGAAQGAFEQARVKLGSAQENTNAVERNAAAPFCK